MGKKQLRTRLCGMLGIEYPLFCAAMGGFRGRPITSESLTAAVSNAGGMGCLAAGSMSPEELRRKIRKTKELTSKPFGVNIMFPSGLAEITGTEEEIVRTLPLSHVAFVEKLKKEYEIPEVEVPKGSFVEYSAELSEAQFEVVLDENIPLLSSALGTPDWVIQKAHVKGMKVMALVGRVKQARRVASQGADIIVAQGYEAGGHTGKIATLVLVPRVVDAVYPLPVVAAGGIGDARGLVAALTLGATGVWLGTAFLTSREANLSDVKKRRLLQAEEDDTLITRAVSGKPTRDLENLILKAWEKEDVSPLPMPFQTILMASLIEGIERTNRGDIQIIPCGQGVGLSKGIRDAKQIVEEMVEGAIKIIKEKLPAEVIIA